MRHVSHIPTQFQLRASETNVIENELKQLVKQQKNDELKNYILENNSSSSSTHMTTILYLAAKYNNLDIIKYLIDTGINITNTITSSTTLTTALIHKNYRIVEYLLRNNVSYLYNDDKSALKLALKTKAPKYTIKCFIDNLKNRQLDINSIAEILTNSHFPLKYLQLIEDSELSELILDRQDLINDDQSVNLIRRSMKSTCTSNIRTLALLMQHGPGNNARKKFFIRELSNILDSPFPSKRYVTSLIRKLIELKTVDEVLVRYAEIAFYTRKNRTVRILLESEIDLYVKETTGQDLKVYLFGNRKLKASRLMKQQGFDVNSKGRRGLNALHYAVSNGLFENARYLLDNGANANVRDDLGITPLFYANDLDCALLLLERGADVEASKLDGLTILDSDCCEDTLMMLIGRVAVMEVLGKDISQKTRDSIDGCRRFKNFYRECLKEIEWMRTKRIFKYGTMFTVLIKTLEELVGFAKDLNEKIDFRYYKERINRYYYFMVKKKLKKALKIYRLKVIATKVILEVFDMDYLVIEKIVDYLSYEQLLAFQ